MYIAQIALPIPNKYIFDYLVSKNTYIQIGCRVLIPFRKKRIIGIIVSVKTESNIPMYKIKKICNIIDHSSLFTPFLWQTLIWTSKYYHYPLGKLLFQFLPKLLKKNALHQLSCTNKNEKLIELKNFDNISKNNVIKFKETFYLENKYKKIVSSLLYNENKFGVYFFSQITQLEKNKIYNFFIEKMIFHSKQILILFPEIKDVKKFALYLKSFFSVTIDTLHSNINNKEKMNCWLRAKTGVNTIIIGTRSALFMPFVNLGLIIIEKEHDFSYKEKQGLRYQARDIAIIYAKKSNIPIIMSSNNPSLETILNIKKNKYHNFSFSKTNKINNKIYNYLIDLNNIELKNGLSDVAIQKIRQHIKNNKKIFILHNKIGSTLELYCSKCGWKSECNKCEHFFTIRKSKNMQSILFCHYCNIKKKIPNKCLICKDKNSLFHNRDGEEQTEAYLNLLFPEISIYRINNTIDSKKLKEYLNHLILNKKTSIFIGTKNFLKQYNNFFSFIDLVIFIDIDSVLFSSNFRSIEVFSQDYNLLLNNIKKNSEIVLQTKDPEHYLLNKLISSNYYQFSLSLLKKRKEMRLPPFTYHAIFRVQHKIHYIAIEYLKKIINLLINNANNDNLFDIFGPFPFLKTKKNHLYSWQILLQHNSRKILHQIINSSLYNMNDVYKTKKIKLIIDIDPIDI